MKVFLNLIFWSALLFCQFANAACVVSGDAIYKIVSFYQDFEAEISAASAGNLICSNSTIVNPEKENKPIEIIDYNLSINLDGNDEQPASVALVALVSDDGCDAFLDEKQWISECKKGQDISTGARRYHELLLPGVENSLKIKYSQTFYDPEILDEDLDGLSLILFPIEIDISVKDALGKMNDRILVKKGEIIEIALSPIFWREKLPDNKLIEWELGQLNSDGNFTWNKITETGAKISLKMKDSGIFKLRACINGQYFYYLRHQDVPNCENENRLYAGADDFIGVYEKEIDFIFLNTAYSYNDAKKFAKSAQIKPGYGVTSPVSTFGTETNYKDAWKCNIFVIVMENESGINAKPIKRIQKYDILNMNIFYHEYYSPATVLESNSENFIIPVENGILSFVKIETTRPRPGIIVMDEDHMGILDYDGFWINAGEKEVHKRIFWNDRNATCFRIYEN